MVRKQEWPVAGQFLACDDCGLVGIYQECAPSDEPANPALSPAAVSGPSISDCAWRGGFVCGACFIVRDATFCGWTPHSPHSPEGTWSCSACYEDAKGGEGFTSESLGMHFPSWHESCHSPEGKVCGECFEDLFIMLEARAVAIQSAVDRGRPWPFGEDGHLGWPCIHDPVEWAKDGVVQRGVILGYRHRKGTPEEARVARALNGVVAEGSPHDIVFVPTAELRRFEVKT